MSKDLAKMTAEGRDGIGRSTLKKCEVLEGLGIRNVVRSAGRLGGVGRGLGEGNHAQREHGCMTLVVGIKTGRYHSLGVRGGVDV